jgi:hypothetical protein
MVEILKNKKEKAQSFVELALILPIILLILLGLVEVSFFISRYLDVMDLTREAARFASIRDPEIGKAWISNHYDCDNPNDFNFYYHTACLFSPPDGSPIELCPNPRYCNGLNPLVYLDAATDDVVITVFGVTGSQTVDNVYPDIPDSLTDNYWAFSDHDEVDLVNNENWKKDCEGNVILSEPHYTAATVQTELVSGSPTNKGFVGVEFFYCYHQVLNLPIANWVVPDPLRIHAYSIMPLPAAQPTPTP